MPVHVPYPATSGGVVLYRFRCRGSLLLRSKTANAQPRLSERCQTPTTYAERIDIAVKSPRQGSSAADIMSITAMLARIWTGHVHRRVLGEEACRFEHKAGVGHGHHRPVFWPREMVNSHRVPGDKVGIL